MNVSAATPLAVDLDGTLWATDSTLELAWALLLEKRLGALAYLGRLRQGRDAFKAGLTQAASLELDEMPWNRALLGYLAEERARGRALYLVSAANEGLAKAAAGYLGLFEDAWGSRPDRPLKGQRKAAFLRRAFPGGFLYAGDSTHDLPVWAQSQGAIVVGDLVPKAIDGSPIAVLQRFAQGEVSLLRRAALAVL